MSDSVSHLKFFANPLAFREWLEANASKSTELLVGFHKVDSGRPSLSWPESVDEALCFGWIDGVRKRIDDHSYSIRFTPRKPTSIWSSVNIRKIETLSAQGRMTEAGLRAFAHRIEHRSEVYAYEQAAAAELSPQEFQAFKREKEAWKFFANTPPGYKTVVLHWITTAKKVETRASRLAKLISACVASQRLK